MSGFVSARGRRLTSRRLVVTLALCLAGCAVVALVAPLVGVTPDRRFEVLPLSALGAASPLHVVFVIRAKQVAEALLVGSAAAGAGCALQALLRNPLADPFVLGISSGSSLAAVLAIWLGIERWFGAWGVGGAALVGAVATLVVVVQLARVGRGLPPATLLLAGLTISIFCSSASTLVQYLSAFAEQSRMLAWLFGGLDPGRFDSVKYLAIPLVAGLVALVSFARELDALAAGPEVAASLGVAVARTQNIVFALASLIVGLAIAIGGPIGFVGLIVPNVLRTIVGPDHRVLLPASLLGGAALVVLCDTLARTLAAPSLLPTGAVTAVLGGPFFVAILIAQKRKAAMW